MKKLLATLLVAAMLISCMSIVAFATESSELSIGSSLTFDPSVTKKGKNYLLTDDFTAAYEAYAADNYADYDAAYEASSLFAALEDLTGNDDGAFNALTFPYVFSGDEFIPVPFYADGDGVNTVGAYLDYDHDVLEPVLTATTFDTNSIKNNKLYVSYAAAEPTVGLVGVAYFTIKSGAVGDANGNASTTITMSLGSDGWATTAVDLTPATIGNNTLTVSLSGLTPGSSAKEDITAAEMPAAEVPAFTASASDDAAWLANANVVNGDNVDVDLENGAYTAAFGNTANYSAYNTPDKFGIALYADNELKGYYEAKNIIEGKFGILFFGLKDGVTYTMKNYVQYGEEAPIVAE